MRLPLGTLGAGLYTEGGGLAGVISYFRANRFESEINYAVSGKSIAAALQEERVVFAGRRLL